MSIVTWWEGSSCIPRGQRDPTILGGIMAFFLSWSVGDLSVCLFENVTPKAKKGGEGQRE